jgi:hypothetical protein
LAEQSDATEITLSGRRIYGATPPGEAVWCARTAPLTPLEIDEVVELVAQGRLARRSVHLPERLWTRHWDSTSTGRSSSPVSDGRRWGIR